MAQKKLPQRELQNPITDRYAFSKFFARPFQAVHCESIAAIFKSVVNDVPESRFVPKHILITFFRFKLHRNYVLRGHVVRNYFPNFFPLTWQFHLDLSISLCFA